MTYADKHVEFYPQAMVGIPARAKTIKGRVID